MLALLSNSPKIIIKNYINNDDKKTSHLETCNELINILFVSHAETIRTKTLEFIDTLSNIIKSILSLFTG